jgi:mRNA interferase HigB
MVIILARKTLRRFAESRKGHSDYQALKTALDAWFHEAQKAEWKTPAEVKAQFKSASIVADRIVFNIKGNSYRLIVAADYLRKTLFIKWLGTHKDYDRIDVAKVQYGFKAD